MIKKDFWVVRTHIIQDRKVSFERPVTEDEAIEAVFVEDNHLIADVHDETEILILKASISPEDGGIDEDSLEEYDDEY